MRKFFRVDSLPSHGVKPYYALEIGPRRAHVRLSYGGYRLPVPGKLFGLLRYPGISTSFAIGHAALSFVRRSR